MNKKIESIKKKPAMVIIGNPPYSVSSSNRGQWIENLIETYKKNLNEKSHNLTDDYIKFIRLGQHYIEKNGEGILAYITNNSFLDAPTMRIMRKSLLKTFNKIYIINLHGNVRKKEKTPSGENDENVFNIMQGTSINIFIKTKEKKEQEIFYYDLWGKREEKYKFLKENSIKTINWEKITPQEEYYYFIPRDYKKEKKYKKGFQINKIFKEYGSGIQTGHDKFAIETKKENLIKKIKDFQNSNPDKKELYQKFNLKERKKWDIIKAWKSIQKENNLQKYIHPIQYRPFDNQFIFYNKNLLERTAKQIMKHLIQNKNIGLIFTRQMKNADNYTFISKNIIDKCSLSGTTYIAPLYLYNNNKTTLNIKADFIKEFQEKTKMKFRVDFNEYNLIHYIYAILYHHKYTNIYKDFLSTDFPRVPFPKNKEIFLELSKLGKILIETHLGKNIKTSETTFPIKGSNKITKKITILNYEKGKVYINKEQYFDNIPLEIWNYNIGSYKPAQRWLKYRYNQKLSYDDIQYYKTIIEKLKETIKITEKINKIELNLY